MKKYKFIIYISCIPQTCCNYFLAKNKKSCTDLLVLFPLVLVNWQMFRTFKLIWYVIAKCTNTEKETVHPYAVHRWWLSAMESKAFPSVQFLLKYSWAECGKRLYIECVPSTEHMESILTWILYIISFSLTKACCLIWYSVHVHGETYTDEHFKKSPLICNM